MAGGGSYLVESSFLLDMRWILPLWLLGGAIASAWVVDLGKGSLDRDVPVTSISTGSEHGLRYYEANTRLTDDQVLTLVKVDKFGQIYLNEAPTSHDLPLKVFVSSWATGETCSGLDYLLHPLVLLRSHHGQQVTHHSNYYGLACSDNRTNWCQRDYKKDVLWPREMEKSCLVSRNGVDKSRCYRDGQMEISFGVECQGSEGGGLAFNVTYHLLQGDQPVRKQTHNRVRRALAAKPPFFKRNQYAVNVKEEGNKQHLVTSVQAVNPQGGSLQYSMVSLLDSRTQELFSIDPNTGTITTKKKLDREFMDVHYLRVVAATEDRPPLTATTTVQINVEDVNDHIPTFEEKAYSADVKESVSQGSSIITVRASDKDSGKNGEVLYSIKSQSSKPDVFRIEPSTGVISTRLQLDREQESSHSIIVEAIDQGAPTGRLTASTSVTITILDENDNYPQFTQKTYYFKVSEDINWAQRPVVGGVRALDIDEGLNSMVYYSIIGGNTASQFTVDEDSGDIFVIKKLDHETTKTYRLVIRAQDRGSPTRSNTTQVIINVEDVNDHSPKFYSQYFQEAVDEGVQVGYSIVRIQAYDGDGGENSRISYTLVEHDTSDYFPFAIDEKTGWLTTTKPLDRETTSGYQFGVKASDNGRPPRNSTAAIIIQVQDRNDNDPVYQRKTYEVSTSETDPPGTTVTNVLALDKDENSRVHYEITGGNTRNRFSITTQNAQGVISIAQPLDYQQEKRFLLTISATDSGGRFDTATVYINVTDSNTHPPTFENSPYSVGVFEDAPVDTTVLVVAASDKDVGENARITYSLSDEQNADFKIDSSSGAIIINRPLDREHSEVYVLTVTAHDNGIPRMSDTTDVEIVIVDVNDNKPVFTEANYHGSVLEDAIPGSSILEILATDRDQNLNGRIMYTFEGGSDGDGAFIVDGSSGIVRTNRPLDRETTPYYELMVLAVDRGTPQLSSAVPLMIEVKDINDNPPNFSTDKLEFFINENSPIGSLVGNIEAEDPDEGENAKVSYSIIGGKDSALFKLDTQSGKSTARLISNTEFDHESEKTVYEILLRAESPPLRTDIPVVIKVRDQNDNSPQLSDFQIVFNNYENNFPTTPIGKIPAYDADATDSLHYNLTYGNNDNVLILNHKTGEISLSPKLNTNVPLHAKMGVSVHDGKNEVRSVLNLDVLLVTKEMMHHSVTLRLNNMTQEAFLSPLFSFFVDGLGVVIGAPRENIHVFSIKPDTEVQTDILNVTFSVARSGSSEEQYVDPSYIQHKVYLNLETLIRLSTITILPFDDNICILEPCLNFEHCQTRLMFGSATHFEEGESILFRSIHPVKTHSCKCPPGFTGEKNHYVCNIEVDMCYSNPCQNKGTCFSREGSYTCVCPENFAGENCEICLHNMEGERLSSCPIQDTCNQDICAAPSACKPLIKGGFICENCTQSPFYNDFCQLEARSFSNGAFLSLPSLTQRFKLNIQLEFATVEHSGLLLYNGRFNGKHDFISLVVENERVKFMFSTGDKTAEVSVEVPGGVSDGQWHQVEIQYHNRSAVLIVDGCDANLALKHGRKLGKAWRCANKTTLKHDRDCSRILNTCYKLLDLTGPLQIGALPGIHKDAKVPTPLDGCIRNIKIDHKFIDLNNFVENNGTLNGCPERREFCMSHPCQHGGTCREGWGGYVCKCPSGWGGKDCGQKLKPAKHLKGNGFAIYNAGLYPIQLPWHNSLSFRTMEMDGLLMKIQIRKVGWSTLRLSNGTLEYELGDARLQLITPKLNDGDWHNVKVKWMLGEIWLNLDYGQHELTKQTNIGIQGINVGKVSVGGEEQNLDGTGAEKGFDGCIENVRVGSETDEDLSPTLASKVREGCPDQNTCSVSSCPERSTCNPGWSSNQCSCDSSYVGEKCEDVCYLNPCEHNSTCSKNVDDERGYTCSCSSSLFSGEYCEKEIKQPCPANWWGDPVCGPCQCDINLGYNPNCDKKHGTCFCKDYHYKPEGSENCLPCDCFAIGSKSQLCNASTGQCECKEGVIGRLCDSCAHKSAEVTEDGCQVVYESCPKSYVSDVWWPRTRFDKSVEVSCPEGAEGKAVRECTAIRGWSKPDLFNCTHRQMLQLFNDLTQLQDGNIQMNSYLALKTAKNLYDMTESIKELYGADILLISRLLTEILRYEIKQSGFNLSHKRERDFIKQIVNVASRIMDEENQTALKKINRLDDEMFTEIMTLFKAYGVTLSENRADTYTNPFEITSENVIFGLDVIDLKQGLNAEARVQNDNLVYSSKGIHSSETRTELVTIPKYNHYMRDVNSWDLTKILIPKGLLSVNGGDAKPTVSYAFYRTLPEFLPNYYQYDLTPRWGSYFQVISSITSLSIYTHYDLQNDVELTTPISIVYKVKFVRDHSSPFCARWDSKPDPENNRHTRSPVAVSLDSSPTPQADYDRPGWGWTKEGCETELPDLWRFSRTSELEVNCTCYRVGTYAVLTESAAAGLQPIPVISDNTVFYATIASLVILLSAAIAFSMLYGLPTNTNSIHRWIVVSLFLAQMLFILAAKYHEEIVDIDFACKMVAILLHYFWLCVFSWLLVDALHLYRMLTELRDINHGHMKFYVSTGFGIPAIIVGLSVGVRGHQFGTLRFCWLSLYDVSVWSMVGPICISFFVQICILFLAIRAAFTLKSQIEDFGNLRGLLLLNIGLLPLVTGTWTCAFFLVNEDWHELGIAFSIATLVTSSYIFLGYVAFNSRVRAGIRNRCLVCSGKKVPYGESLHTSHGTISRSALAYRNSVKSSHRNIGISTASTTSRSTSKTNSVPYRSDYYSSSDVSKVYGTVSHKSGQRSGQEFTQRETDSDSDLEQRSLDLASSHSSDEDEPLEPITSSDTTHGNNYSVDYSTAVPPLHINTSSGSAGLQVSDQPMSAQNTLQRHHMPSHGQDNRLNQRWSERLSAITTSDNDNMGMESHLGYSAYGTYGGSHGYGHTGSPGSHSEMSSEDKYVAMSPPNLLLQHRQYTGSDPHHQYSTSDPSQNYSTSDPSLQPSDISPESHHIS